MLVKSGELLHRSLSIISTIAKEVGYSIKSLPSVSELKTQEMKLLVDLNNEK